MTYQARPSERAGQSQRADFWAIVEAPAHVELYDTTINHARISPAFATQADLTGWLRNQPGEVLAFRRDFNADRTTFKDVPLVVRETPVERPRV